MRFIDNGEASRQRSLFICMSDHPRLALSGYSSIATTRFERMTSPASLRAAAVSSLRTVFLAALTAMPMPAAPSAFPASWAKAVKGSGSDQYDVRGCGAW